MLEALVGNQNIQRILLFLFVNGKCYGSQLQRLLKTPLTPIQKALARLEKGGIIISGYEGKTRLYWFNSAYPPLSELEQLLKKTYTLLPSQQKKCYNVVQSSGLQNHEENQKLLLVFWERLAKVTELTFQASSKSKEVGGWSRKGRGEVTITKKGEYILLFQEKGSWLGKDENEINFSNIFRWTFDPHAGVISLEHLRRGLHQPVFLFHLAPSSARSLSSVDLHLCEGDSYFVQIFFDRHTLRLHWRVIGSKKNEEIEYHYL